jgi:hypothetical protein
MPVLLWATSKAKGGEYWQRGLMPAEVRQGCYTQCYYAIREKCECACGGQNHQVGHQASGGGQAMTVAGQQLVATSVSGDSRPGPGDPPPPPPPPPSRGHHAAAAPASSEPARTGTAGDGWDDATASYENDDVGGGTEATEEERERIAAVLAAQASQAAAQALADTTITYRQPLGGTANDVERITLADGSTAYLKPVEQEDTSNILGYYGVNGHEQATHEAAAFHLACAMGERYTHMVPTTALTYDDEHGMSALSAHRDGTPGMLMDWRADSDFQQVSDAAFFDAVCGNTDRHAGNFLVDHDGSLSLIDHGFAFHKPGGAVNATQLQEHRVGMGFGRLDPHEIETLERLGASPSLLGVAPMIGEERAEAMRERIADMLNTERLPASLSLR